MSNMIYKFNQKGVSQNVQLGKKGGHIAWDTTEERFVVSNSAQQNAVFISPLTQADYSATTSSKISPNNLVTAGYVQSLIQGMRTKKSVQTATNGTNLIEAYFSPIKSPLQYSVTGGLHRNVLSEATIRQLFGFDVAIYTPADPTNPLDAAYGKLREVWTVGTRILVKNQTHVWQNGIYEFAAGTDCLYLKRSADMDVEDEVEGAYVYVEQGTLESTGWVGNVPGSPESILDMRAPMLKAIEFNAAGDSTNYTTADGTAGFTAVTFQQFHGQGTYVGDTKSGVVIHGNKIGIDYADLDLADGETATKALITATGVMAIEVNNAGTKSFYKRSISGMLHNEFRLFPHSIRDREEGDAGFEVKVSTSKDSVGSAIVFSVPTMVSKPGYIARPNLLNATVDEFKVDFGGNVSSTLSNGVAKGSNITMIAGGTDLGTGEGGDIVLRAGNVGSTATTAVPGHIILSGGFKDTAHLGTVKIEGAALNLPVGDNAARSPSGSADLIGAIRLNSEIETGIHTLEYFNKNEWVQVDGASYFIHDKVDHAAGETAFDTFISTMGTEVNASGKVEATQSNTLTFASKNKKVMSARYDFVKITPEGTVTIAPVASDLSGDVTITTPVANAGSATAASSGVVAISTGANTASTTSGSQSGKITLETGDHKYKSGDIEISTGDVTGTTVTNPTTGSVYLSTGKPSTAADATIGTVYVGVSKAAAADVTYADVTVHYHNNVVIGDAGSTQKVTVKAETISIGENAGADTTIGHNDTTTPANSSGDVVIFGQNVVIAGNDESTAGSTKGVTIKGRNVKLGTENTTTNIEVGHISDAASGLTGSTVDVRGSVVSVSTDNELKFKSTKDGGNIAFETNVKDNGGGSFTGGVLTVSDPDYYKSCVLPEAIPNVKYVQKIIKDGQFGPGNRTLQITQGAAPASQYAFKIGDDLPANTKITRVSITVSTGFAWTSGGHGAAIVLANNRTDAQTGGTIIMPESDSDIEMLVSGGDTQTFMTEFGAGYDVSTTGVYVVFNSLFRPDNATAGDIRVLVEFVAMERGIANS